MTAPHALVERLIEWQIRRPVTTLAIVAATSNVVGGFLITDRMLKMFKTSGPKK